MASRRYDDDDDEESLAKKQRTLMNQIDSEDDNEEMEEDLYGYRPPDAMLKVGYKIARAALLNGGKPIKRKTIRDIAVESGCDGREKQNAAHNAALYVLAKYYGLKLYPLAEVARPQHGASTKDELILCSVGPKMIMSEEPASIRELSRRAVADQRSMRRKIYGNASTEYADMMCVLNLSLAFLVLEPGGFAEDDLVDLLKGTNLFADDDNTTIKAALDGLVAQRLLDVNTQPGATATSSRVKIYDIGPTSLACVSEDTLLSVIVRLLYPSYKGGEKTPEQAQTIDTVTQRLRESVFMGARYSR